MLCNFGVVEIYVGRIYVYICKDNMIVKVSVSFDNVCEFMGYGREIIGGRMINVISWYWINIGGYIYSIF